MAINNASLDSVFHALSDPTRRAVLQQLVDGPASIKTLAEPFDMALPSFLKHITVLEDCGLIGSKKVGRVRTCRMKPKKLIAAESWMVDQRALWEGRTDRMATYVESLAAKDKKT